MGGRTIERVGALVFSSTPNSVISSLFLIYLSLNAQIQTETFVDKIKILCKVNKVH